MTATPTDTADALRSAAERAAADIPAEVRFAYLFGSRATGRARPDSDVDVAVLLDDGLPAHEADRVAASVGERLSAESGLARIEVVVLNDAELRFAGRVLRDRVVIFSRDEERRVAYESLVGRMADDVEVWAAPLDRELLAAIAEGRR
ncbi:nucleotidyltransferase domain-containing protein [Pseudonocardia nematodicida]|uniref:Nucleotidyltransferase domain-containing protein n=1 Tax=Pseudonocardia nematodicida TaxID=1206997 RepID=A0ABV1KF59_9PSEU